jgi:hypothetical protein
VFFLVFSMLAGCGLLDALRARDEAGKSDPGEQHAIEIVEGGDSMPGNAKVLSDGKPLWPPEGPGCERLIACCNAASKESSAVGLACQMSVAAEPLDCAKALESVQGIISELGLMTPGECK